MFLNIKDFYYETSEINWCENNYYFHDSICEFNNSWSSLLYMFFGLYIYYNYSKYIKNNLIYLIIISSIFIGITSFLFHSTLSIAGQLMDEGSIILFIITSDLVINNTYYLTLLFSIFLIMSLFIPFYCRFILLGLGCIIIYNTIQNIKNRCMHIYPYFYHTLKILFLAIAFWVIDLVFCDYLIYKNKTADTTTCTRINTVLFSINN